MKRKNSLSFINPFSNVKEFVHIICHEVPWPATTGPAIDCVSRMSMLKKLGIGIHLHYSRCSGEGTPNELNQYCDSIHIYEKQKNEGFSLFRLPGICTSGQLKDKLEKDDHPIILEGMCHVGTVSSMDTRRRKVMVRIHDEGKEREISKDEVNPGIVRKFYAASECSPLLRYKNQLPPHWIYACTSENDVCQLKYKMGLENVELLRPFPAWQKVNAEEGIGNFCLYHGNLSEADNEEAAIWLLSKVFTKVRVPFIIAGKTPSRRLQKAAQLCQHTCLASDPGETEMNDLIRKAHINILPSFDKCASGTRLKLLHALYQGRHCVVNEPMVEGTGLEAACHIGKDSNAIASIIAQLYRMPFSEEEIRLRKRLLSSAYDNEKNTRQVIQWLS